MVSKKNSEDVWVCPSDRHLSLRAKLNSGWSVRGSYQEPNKRLHSLSAEELEHIQSVISRAVEIEHNEQKRIGSMVHRLETMKNKSSGDGLTRCILCAEKFGKFAGVSAFICMDCKKKVCDKCSVDYTSLPFWKRTHPKSSPHKTSSLSSSKSTSWLCKICSENREVWKRSGAWFFNSLPKYILPEIKPVEPSNRYTSFVPIPPDATSNDSSDVLLKGGNYSQFKSVGRRRSSSSESDDDSFLSQKSRPRSAIDKQNEDCSAISPPLQLDSNPFTSISQNGGISPVLYSQSNQRNPLSAQSSSEGSSLKGSIDEDISDKGLTSQSPTQRRRNPSGLTVPGGRKRKLSRTRHKLKGPFPPEGEHGKEDNSSMKNSGTSPQMRAKTDQARRSFQGNAAKQQSPSLAGGNYIEKIDPVHDNSGPLGSIEFTILYDPTKVALLITIVRARNLRAMDINGFSDPYVKLHLLPGSKKSTKLRTRTKQKTLNPNFDETLTYWGITENDINRKRVRLTVLDEDRFSQNDFLGEVIVDLKEIEPMKAKIYNMALEEHSTVDKVDEEDESDNGRILLSLCFIENSCTLIVTIIRCAGLPPVARSNSIDPQIKACLQIENNPSSEVVCQRTERKKSTRTSNPAFNESLRLPTSGGTSELSKCRLDVSVWDKDVMGKDHLIGYLSFGIMSKGAVLRHWFDCLKSPGTSIEKWHNLERAEDSGKISALASAGKYRGTPRVPK